MEVYEELRDKSVTSFPSLDEELAEAESVVKVCTERSPTQTVLLQATRVDKEHGIDTTNAKIPHAQRVRGDLYKTRKSSDGRGICTTGPRGLGSSP